MVRFLIITKAILQRLLVLNSCSVIFHLQARCLISLRAQRLEASTLSARLNHLYSQNKWVHKSDVLRVFFPLERDDGKWTPWFCIYQQWNIARLKGGGTVRTVLAGLESWLGLNFRPTRAGVGVCRGVITGNDSDKSAILDEWADAEIDTFGRKTLF